MTIVRVPHMPAATTPRPPSRSTDGQLLAALPSAVGCVGRFARFTVERWRLFDLVDTAEVVTVELVGAAVSASGIAVEHPGYLDLYDRQLNLVDLRLDLTGTHLVIQAWDANPMPRWPREPARESASSWNFYLPPHGGKVVWVALEIPPALLFESAQRPALPRRTGCPRAPVPPAPVQPVESMTDHVLLNRVRDGLRRLDTNRPPRPERVTEDQIHRAAS